MRRTSSNGGGTATCIRFLSQNRPGPRMGMGHYERLLIHHLMRAAGPAEWRFEIVFDGRSGGVVLDPAQVEPGMAAARFSGFSALRLARWPWGLTKLAARVGSGLAQPNLYHSLALSCPVPGGRPAVYTIHDLPPARFDDEGAVARWARRAAQEAAAIVTPSEFGKRELVELLGLDPARVHVVPYGCEHDRFNVSVPPANPESLAKYGLKQPFLLYAGGFTRRKNVRALLDAWRAVAARHPELTLALVGPKVQLQKIAEDAKSPRVQVVGYLSRDELPAVLRASMGLVCPSIYEGFGLPPLEAMASGVPVVAVRAGAIPEVVGEAAILVEDGTPEQLTAGMAQLLDDMDKARQLRELGPQRATAFSWAVHAERMLDLYRQVSEGKAKAYGRVEAAASA